MPKQNMTYHVDDIGIIDHEHQINNFPNSKTIEAVKEWLVSNMMRSSKKSKFTSYWLKHQAEKTIGHYVSNGVMIMALMESGYRVDRAANSKNCYVYGVLNETA